ncbi:MAG TPA: hypothetical protein VF698_06475 [Thermoanaerobaculia bacterium]|jgi:ketosteroid isomerase-like protein
MQRTLIAASLLFAACTSVPTTSQRVPSAEPLAAAERAFAQTSVDEGQRAAWIRYFADEGIEFAPGPVKAKERAAGRPAQTKPFPATLYWEPVYGAIARSGELGFNTGPWRFRDNKGERADAFGYFFSVWKKQADDSWKVVLDLGARPKVDGDPMGQPFVAGAFGVGHAARTDDLLALDRQIHGVDGLTASLHDRAWVLRDGMDVMRSAGAARANLTAAPLELTPLGGDVVMSGDLGYTYGEYTRGTEKGHYAHVWIRDEATGTWKIALDVNKPESRTQG